jgi:hypothetical protein
MEGKGGSDGADVIPACWRCDCFVAFLFSLRRSKRNPAYNGMENGETTHQFVLLNYRQKLRQARACRLPPSLSLAPLEAVCPA